MRKPISQKIICIKSAGEMASAVAWRLYQAHFRRIFMLEVPRPLAVRRRVAFSETIYTNCQTIETVTAVKAADIIAVTAAWAKGHIPVLVDPGGETIAALQPDVIIDAILAKKNLGTHLTQAPLVIGLGPGFDAGQDVHIVIETNRGHDLGRIITSGPAQPNTGIPGNIAGYARRRVLRAPRGGRFQTQMDIGRPVKRGDIIGTVDDQAVCAEIDGVIRGLVRSGIDVSRHMKLGDIDPRGITAYCDTISDKARAISGSVIEAVLRKFMAPLNSKAAERSTPGRSDRQVDPSAVRALASRVVNGQAGAVSNSIRHVENQTELAIPLLAALRAHTGNAHKIGITGPPGVGKSTFISRLVGLFRSTGASVGVIAVDPSSPASGGALLGDRLRMQAVARDPGVFIRSMAARGEPGGLARQAVAVADILDATGKDIILFETVGVGQTEFDIVSVADTVITLTMPGTGDIIQGMKAGLMEIGDILVVHKADLPGARQMQADLELVLELRGHTEKWQRKVWLADSKKGTGLEPIYHDIKAHLDFLLTNRAERNSL